MARVHNDHMTITVRDIEVYAETDVDVDVYAEDLTPELVKMWVETTATQDDLLQVFSGTDEKNIDLESLYKIGKVSLFDVREFLNNHMDDLALHSKLFP